MATMVIDADEFTRDAAEWLDAVAAQARELIDGRGDRILARARDLAPKGATGKLEDSFKVLKKSGVRAKANYSIVVGSDVYYSFFLEFGTSHNKPSPMLRPAVNEER